MTRPSKYANNPALSGKSLARQLVACAVILLVAWGVWRRGQPERLSARFYDVELIARGSLYRTGYRNASAKAGPMIFSRPVHGAERIVADEEERYTFGPYPMAIAVDDGGVFYGIQRRKMPAATVGHSGGRPGRRYLGTFTIPERPDMPPLAPDEKRVPLPESATDPDPILFRQTAGTGGPARDLATVRGRSAILVGSHAFWNRRGRETRFEVSRGSDAWTEVSGSSDLMLTDLTTGREHRLGRIHQPFTDWIVGKDGVFWTTPRPSSDRGVDLFYARASTGTVLRLGVLPQGSTVDWSVEFEGSLYWFAQAESDTARQDILMAASLDGSGVREALRLAPLK